MCRFTTITRFQGKKLSDQMSTSTPSLPNDSYVIELIGADNTWDVAKIHQHFVKEDADLIISIPLPKEPKEDQLFWHYDKHGNYSVKSGYQITQKIRFPSPPSSSQTSLEVWKNLWSLMLPAKVRNFIWRAVKNVLPTADNLWQKKIIHDTICQVCKRQAESIVHVLFKCKVVRKVWK